MRSDALARCAKMFGGWRSFNLRPFRPCAKRGSGVTDELGDNHDADEGSTAARDEARCAADE
jgi:hypothetical protein